MENFVYFYESITQKKKLLIRMNDNISHCLGQLIYEYYIILSFKV